MYHSHLYQFKNGPDRCRADPLYTVISSRSLPRHLFRLPRCSANNCIGGVLLRHARLGGARCVCAIFLRWWASPASTATTALLRLRHPTVSRTAIEGHLVSTKQCVRLAVLNHLCCGTPALRAASTHEVARVRVHATAARGGRDGAICEDLRLAGRCEGRMRRWRRWRRWRRHIAALVEGVAEVEELVRGVSRQGGIDPRDRPPVK